MHPLHKMSQGQLQTLCRALADAIKAIIPPDTGFFFAFSPFGTGGVAQYAANINRPDAVKMLRETADRLERKETNERDHTAVPPSLN